MREIPIQFCSESIPLIQSGVKLVTRRLRGLQKVNQSPDLWKLSSVKNGVARWTGTGPCRGVEEIACPYGASGDFLWVKETWRLGDGMNPEGDPTKPTYAADWQKDLDCIPVRWKPSMFMPKRFCRIWLENVKVTAERLQDITEADSILEGCVPSEPMTQAEIDEIEDKEAKALAMALGVGGRFTAKFYYMQWWNSLNGKSGHGWSTNPWVWVVRFKRAASPVDEKGNK